MTNAKNRTPGVSIVTSPVICAHCRRPAPNLVIETIEGIDQLRVNIYLINKFEANCQYCGYLFRWWIRDKDVEKMTSKYQELINLYSPE